MAGLGFSTRLGVVCSDAAAPFFALQENLGNVH
jgi:hypothetical protein